MEGVIFRSASRRWATFPRTHWRGAFLLEKGLSAFSRTCGQHHRQPPALAPAMVLPCILSILIFRPKYYVDVIQINRFRQAGLASKPKSRWASGLEEFPPATSEYLPQEVNLTVSRLGLGNPCFQLCTGRASS